VTRREIASDVFVVQAVVANTGPLPTYLSQAAIASRRDSPIVATIHVEGGELAAGQARAVIGHLEGNMPKSPGYFLFSGGSAPLPSKTLEWVVKAKPGSRASVTVTASCAKGGRDSRQLDLRQRE